MKDLSDVATYAFGTPEFEVKSSYSSSSENPLLEEIRSLKNAVLGMQVVLDSGELVGGIAGGMDAQLGTFAVYKGRGN